MAIKISKVVGIDLGTTNSVIAMMGADNKTIICNTDSDGRRTFPSAVVWDKRSGGIRCGQIAFNRRGTIPEPVTSIKRRMGDSNYRVKVGDRTMSPIEVSAEILKEMKRQMQAYLEKTPGCENYVVDRAVITIPAYFRWEAAAATAKAGELAGLAVVKTLQESSAATAYYCWKNGVKDGIFMVYDLGGNTFDVSIVCYAAGLANDVLGISGNNYLGGDTFDEKLAKMLLETLQDEGYSLDLNLDDEKDAQRFIKLKLAAEVIKKTLSDKEDYFYMHDAIFTDHEGATVNLAIAVTRQDFQDLIAPVLEDTLEQCREALAEAAQKGVTLDMIDGVLLVGGSTHIPYVREFVRWNFCDPSLPVHTKSAEPLYDAPDMAVGFGAAIAAMKFREISIDDSTVDDISGATMEPSKEEFKKLVDECLELNRYHHNSSTENAKKVFGYQQRAAECYDGVMHAYQTLIQIRDFLKPKSIHVHDKPPKWAIVKYGLCLKIREYMREVEKSPWRLPEPLRRQSEAERPVDMALVDKIDKAMTSMTSDEEAIAAIVELRPVMERWGDYLSYNPRCILPRDTRGYA